MLKGKVAIVTGASRGIGAGIALALAEAGANIVGISRSDMSDTCRQVTKHGVEFFELYGDLGSMEFVGQVVPKTISKFEKLDILVNNAGITRRSPAVAFNEQDWDTVLDVNLKAPFFLAQQAVKRFLLQKSGGKIINVCSLMSFQGGINIASYTASKGGLHTLTMLLSNEWAQFGINVNGIAPGYIETELTEIIQNDPARAKQIMVRIPQGRWGKPGDIGGVAVFLASGMSDYINGVTIPVDGGWLGR